MAPAPPPLPTRARTSRKLLLLVAANAAFGLLILANSYSVAATFGEALKFRPAVLSLSRGVEWMVLVPAVAWLIRRFSPRERRWLPLLMAHLAFAVALHSLADVAHTALAFAIDPFLDPENQYTFTFAQFYWRTWNNSLLFHLVTYAAVAGGVYGYDRQVEARRYLEAYRMREVRAARLKAELAQAQLHALRMELNPHFLFNTLSAASALITRDPRRARQVIADLGELLRLSLDTTEEEIPLRDELVFLEHYLRIEEARMGERLRVRIRAGDDVLEALVPPLLLQPLVENAVRHGVAVLEDGGAVEVEAVQCGGDLVLRVRDTGPGLADPAGGAPPRGGVGLRNTRRRLERLYGDAAALALESVPGAGLTATVRLPFRTTQSAAQAAPPG